MCGQAEVARRHSPSGVEDWQVYAEHSRNEVVKGAGGKTACEIGVQDFRVFLKSGPP